MPTLVKSQESRARGRTVGVLALSSSLFAQRGFTVIELLVVAAISSTLFSLVYSGLNSQSKFDDVRFAARQIAQTIRQAEANTRFGVPLSSGSFPPGGYGVQFSATQGYRLVWDIDGTGLTFANGQVWQKLPKNVAFGTGLPELIVFLPPKGVVAMRRSGGWNCSLTPYRAKFCTDTACSVVATLCPVDTALKASVIVTNPQIRYTQSVSVQAITGKVSVE